MKQASQIRREAKCSFGAIVMLLVLTKIGEPQAIENARVDLDAQVANLQ